jgi:deoxyribodipyrimidine photo-lyase
LLYSNDMKTIIVWFRNDLRIHDNPALAQAIADGEQVVPVFILNSGLLKGKHASSNRNRFLLECLQDLKTSLTEREANLLIRHGKPEVELSKLAKEVSADAVYYAADFSPYAIHRDKTVKAQLEKNDIGFRAFPGRLAVSSLDKLHTQAGNPHKVFTPFWKNWQQVQRRELAATPQKICLPANSRVGSVPSLNALTDKADLSPDALPGGETAGRTRLHDFLKHGIADYHQGNNTMGADATSRLSSYLHFGCLSPREIETLLPDNAGARAWHRQLCWREFYHYIIYKFPSNATTEFQDRYKSLKWGQDKKQLQAWQDGKTGYPAVDAAMRQLKQEGWMHNRARLIVGSFLTKDLWLDWRLGELHFMRWLIDGDEANNNGNWQWIASVGVDPAPVFRRMYNPMTQHEKFDPDNVYVKRYVPELKNVPDKYIHQPWTMPEEVQIESGCVIGTDYPGPIVDHKLARLAALDNYRQANRLIKLVYTLALNKSAKFFTRTSGSLQLL